MNYMEYEFGEECVTWEMHNKDVPVKNELLAKDSAVAQKIQKIP